MITVLYTVRKDSLKALPKSVGPRTQEEEISFVPDITEQQLLENPSTSSLVVKLKTVNAATG